MRSTCRKKSDPTIAFIYSEYSKRGLPASGPLRGTAGQLPVFITRNSPGKTPGRVSIMNAGTVNNTFSLICSGNTASSQRGGCPRGGGGAKRSPQERHHKYSLSVFFLKKSIPDKSGKISSRDHDPDLEKKIADRFEK